jgi:hypothetical protein
MKALSYIRSTQNDEITLAVITTLKQHHNMFAYLPENAESMHQLKRMSEICELLQYNDAQQYKDKLLEIESREKMLEHIQEKEKNWDFPKEFICPITQDIMSNPIVASDGHSYEHSAFRKYISKGNNKSPMTREKLRSGIMIPNVNLKKRIRDYPCEILTMYKKNRV